MPAARPEKGRAPSYPGSREPCGEGMGSGEGISHHGSLTATITAAPTMPGPALQSELQPHWYAGGGAASGLWHIALFPRKQEARATGDWRLLICRPCGAWTGYSTPGVCQVVTWLHPRWKGLQLSSWNQRKGRG